MSPAAQRSSAQLLPPPPSVIMGPAWVGPVGGDSWCDSLFAAASSQRFAADQEIYGEGDDTACFFRMVSGVVRTCRFLSDGRRQIDAFHTAGEVFGLAFGPHYDFSAEAVSDCSVLACGRRALEAAIARDADLAQSVTRFAMHRLARAQEHALLLGRRSAMEKVAAFLVDWAGRCGDPGTVSLAMSRLDIADYLGLTIETVSRTLSLLERSSVIALPSARQIRLTDPTALRALNT